MAEWVALLVLVPAVVIPVVLLLGFAGCDLVFKLRRPTSILSAVATGQTSISIEWFADEDRTDSVRIEVFRQVDETLLQTIDNPPSPFEITGLQPNTVHRLLVTAFDDGDPKSSQPALVETLSLAFDGTGDEPASDQPAQGGRCVVQRINVSLLRDSGTRVLMTLRGPTNGAAQISRIFISQVTAVPMRDPYDSAADLTRVDLADNQLDQPLILLQGAGEVPLPIFDYVFDRTQPVLIAFDLTPGFPSTVPLAPVMSGEAVVFFQDNLQEAGIPGGDRTTGYQSINGIALIARIEVV